MRNSARPPAGGTVGNAGRLALVALAAVVGAGCASGGGRPAMTEAEARALVAEYAGSWVLDESGSSPQISAPRAPVVQTMTVLVSGQNRDEMRRQVEAEMQSTVDRYNAIEVLRRRPETLELRAEGVRLIYDPDPGLPMTLPVDGRSVVEPGGGEPVQVRIAWDGPGLGIEYVVGVDNQVRTALEIVDGRLKMTRTALVFGETVAPMVLWYDREGG